MKISYHEDTDSLYIHFSSVPTLESEEVSEDTVLHFDKQGDITGIEFYNQASKKVDLSSVEIFGVNSYRSARTLPSSYPWQLISQHLPNRTSGLGIEKSKKNFEKIRRHDLKSMGRRRKNKLAQQAIEYSKKMDVQKVS